MPKLTLNLETVTPLFLGGSDPRGVPELRPPAFRGALRYWLRALLGGLHGGDIATVQQMEGTVFGRASDETGSASAIILRMANPQMKQQSYSQFKRKSGLAYLLFAARGTNSEKERSGLVGKFNLQLSTRPGVSKAQEVFQRAYAALWLLTRLGGVGTRSRRGIGSFQVVQAGGDLITSLPLTVEATTPQALVQELEQGIRTIRGLIGPNLASLPLRTSPPDFDLLHPDVCHIWVVDQTFPSGEDALNRIGEVYQAFRNRRQPDKQMIKERIVNRSKKPFSEPIQRAAFGLPIPFFYKDVQNGTASLEGDGYDRRASPLWMSVVKLANDQYAIVFTWFQAEFSPSDAGLILKRRGEEEISGKAPDDSLLWIFLTGTDPTNQSSLKDEGLNSLKVIYA